MRGLGLAVAATAVLFSGSAVAQSAKFAAIYDTDEVSVGAVVQDVVNGSDSNFTIRSGSGHDTAYPIKKNF